MKKVNIQRDLPNFSEINIEQVEPQLQATLTLNTSATQKLLEQPLLFSWDNLIHPLEYLDDKVHNFWSPIGHLHGVLDSEPLRKVYNACIPILTEYQTQHHHNEKLFNAISSIVENKDFSNLDFAQKKFLEHELRDFRLSGVNLPPFEKEEYTKLSQELARLATKFEENVLDATQGWNKHITNEQALAGLPQHAILTAKQMAEKRKLPGWVFTLEAPSYLSIMKYADDRKLREEMYWAYNTRASDQGPNAKRWDNSLIMNEILKSRLEIARLLSFNNYAQLSLATKMAKSPELVLDFLNQLVDASFHKGEQEIQELRQFAREKHQLTDLQTWDLPYYSEKLRQERYAISQEDLRPYFPEPRVIQGLFTIVKKLFSIEIQEIKEATTWHPDARCYAIFDREGQLRSYFYLDLYARENKRGGAWMDECRSRRILDNNQLQIPVAFVTCNFNAPVNDQPALFTHEDVITLFHEFGHALQHMLTKINYPGVAGINGIPWDAVEVASQFLENWAWEKETLKIISGHYQTGQSLPDELFQKMHLAKNFQSGLQMLRQIEFALFDFRLHSEFDMMQENQIQKILDEVRSKVSLIPVPKYNCFQHAFSHIFAGGYAAGYYSYKWAEVMAADAFSLFKEKGIFNTEVSQKFLETFLESGGARDPMELFIEFRGRKPQIDALLIQSGIITAPSLKIT